MLMSAVEAQTTADDVMHLFDTRLRVDTHAILQWCVCCRPRTSDARASCDEDGAMDLDEYTTAEVSVALLEVLAMVAADLRLCGVLQTSSTCAADIVTDALLHPAPGVAYTELQFAADMDVDAHQLWLMARRCEAVRASPAQVADHVMFLSELQPAFAPVLCEKARGVLVDAQSRAAGGGGAGARLGAVDGACAAAPRHPGPAARAPPHPRIVIARRSAAVLRAAPHHRCAGAAGQ